MHLIASKASSYAVELKRSSTRKWQAVLDSKSSVNDAKDDGVA